MTSHSLPFPGPPILDPNYLSETEEEEKSPRHTQKTPIGLHHSRTMPDIFENTPTPQRMMRSSTSPKFFVTAPPEDDEIAIPSPERKLLNQTPAHDSELNLSHTRSTLPSLSRKNSVYLQIASAKKNPELSESSEDEEDETMLDGTKRSRSKMSTRRKSFLAWVNEKRKSEGGLLPGYIKEQAKQGQTSQRDKRRESFFKWLSGRGFNYNRENSLTEISEDPEFGNGNVKNHAEMTSRTDGVHHRRQRNPFRRAGELMRKITFMKSYRRLPLETRLKNFYDKIEKTKPPVDNM